MVSYGVRTEYLVVLGPHYLAVAAIYVLSTAAINRRCGYESDTNKIYVVSELYRQTRCKSMRGNLAGVGEDLRAFGRIEFCDWVIGVKTAVFSPR